MGPLAFAGATWPSGFDEQILVDALDQPVAVADASDGRSFVAETEGRIRGVASVGQLPPSALYSVSVTTVDDLGLMGIALDLDSPSNHYVPVMRRLK